MCIGGNTAVARGVLLVSGGPFLGMFGLGLVMVIELVTKIKTIASLSTVAAVDTRL